MKKTIAFLLSMIIAYTPALLFASDDIDFNNRYQTTNWKIQNKDINPYQPASSSSQPDYFNTGKWNVAATRDVKSNGSSYKQTVVAKVETTSKELKDTIANRAKNLAKHTKGLGKATAGGFLGSLALTGLMEGIGWVMEEGGNVTKLPEQDNKFRDHEFIYKCFDGSYDTSFLSSSLTGACDLYANSLKSDPNAYIVSIDLSCDSSGRCEYTLTRRAPWNTSDVVQTGIYRSNKISNPNYDPTYTPTREELTPDEIADGVREALESNNPALGAAIAAAVKEAFQDSQLDRDPDTGEIYAPIPKKTKEALDEAGAADLEKVGDDNQTVCVPNIGDLEGACTSMPKKDADKIPTLKCERNTAISDTSCVYVADPDAPPKSTIDKPQIGEDGALPDSCKWFDFLCQWTEWTQEEPDEDTDTEVEIEEEESDFDFDIFDKNRFGVSDQCPAPVEHTMEITGKTVSFSFDLTPLCDVLSFARPALEAVSWLYAAYIVIGAARNG